MPRGHAPYTAQRLLAVLSAVGAFAPHGPQGPDTQAQRGEQEPKAEAKLGEVCAAMLYHLVRYVTPDPEPTTPRQEYRIGLLGDDDTVAVAKKVLPGKKIGDAKVVLVTVSAEDAASGRAAQQCDVLYLAASVDGEALTKVLAAYEKHPLTLASNRPGFAAAGGTVQMFLKDGGLKFEVNRDALQKQHLAASAQLLKHSEKGPAR